MTEPNCKEIGTTRDQGPGAGSAREKTGHEEIALQAAVFRRLRQHLMQERADVQNIDLMILAGFCRNCLADWYHEAAAERGIEMDKAQARETIYGEPFAQWKLKHQSEATPEQLAAFDASKPQTG